MTLHQFLQDISVSPSVSSTFRIISAQQQARVSHQRLRQLISRFAGKRILVLGDMIADEYLIGASTRLSREAPIPIINQQERYIVPGGAMNPAVNVRTLGAEVYVAGIIGDDELGAQLRERMEELGIHHDLLLTERGRPTSSKMRIMASNNQGIVQHVARIDNIDTTPLAEATAQRMMRALEGIIPAVDGIILSDYDNGFMGLSIIDSTLTTAQRHKRIVVADAHGELDRFQNVTAITPNQPEAEAATGVRIHDEASLEKAGNRLLSMTDAESVLLTRGNEGMSLFERGVKPVHIPVLPVEARDTTGAGDTVAATFTLALVAGASLFEAASISNIAAARVVQYLGCATNTTEELLRAAMSLEG